MVEASHPDPRPPRDASLIELEEATSRLLASVRALDDEAMREPSLLPAWTRGHVTTHLARNADGLGHLARWAETGEETPMYLSREQRAADIEAGSMRSASALAEDLEAASGRLNRQLAELPETANDALLVLGSGAQIEGWELPLMRIREVEIHHVDLAADYTSQNWSENFSRRTLDQVAPGFAEREAMPFGWLVSDATLRWRVGPGEAELAGSVQLLLGWLVGRHDGSGLAPTGRGDVPAPPAWA